MGNMAELQTADGFHRFPAYVAPPAGTPRGGIVVLQEIFGVNAHIRAVADGYAAEGYLAVAPSTFSRTGKADLELAYDEAGMKTGFALKAEVDGLPAPGVLDDIAAAITYAAQAGKVGIVGYCWGGLLTWRAACSFGALSAAVPYYGGGMTSEADRARTPRCPVLAHFGRQDSYIPMDTVEAFRHAQPGVQVQVYDTGHGFNCDQRGSYHAESARLARERTLAFFAEHLGG
ncbi:dienelactone hydrolase family protein [Caballeronia zhejiangensis]|uniref:Carboxymethylenebutenolidase n=1 Tax=Caballeronia zhejiangensis TaxID=871203 RepID=A0A656QD61_9BURK|nr:dienelactone hydrolase family protein [Caballeronia zhejiangensis]AET95404.1 Carboxymethylenebutenolidase [Burkholderia sp. YI23]KAK42477.1 carboxymethylenebutenolidase [Caballeronia jiangsuensis]KDR24705.1 carboxymethylenebutenolidase [Caballeronia zhejiangensis]BBQ03175.1 carboxymethylenebutenolidase [Burkholderia sp. SFA1]